ncbi:MAG TPA: tetratricopeptide repeat protein [Candidatus Methylacidiphilales bacterium]
MATLGPDDSNILDAEAINWRLVVYPLVTVVVLVLGGFGYYYSVQSEREQRESQAGEAILQAKTPEQLVQVADKFPKTDQGTLALLTAGKDYFDKKDYDSSIKSFQRVVNTPDVDKVLRDSAQLGIASGLEADGKGDDAISAYLVVAHRGSDSLYAPFAYHAVSTIYEQRNDKVNEQKILTDTVSLRSDSPFVKMAQQRLKMLNEDKAQAPTTSKITDAINAAFASVNATNAAPPVPATNAAPAPKP